MTLRPIPPPTDIELSASSIAENNAVGDSVGTLSSADADAGDTFTYTLVAGTGDTDNGSFNITANSLRTGVAFDFETKSSYSVRVRTTDSANNTFDKVFTITVTDVNETPADTTAPVIALIGSATVTVDWGSSCSDAGATVTDNVDATRTISGTGSVNTSAPGNYTITFNATDAAGNLAAEVTRTVTVSKPSSTPGADGLSPLLRLAFGGTDSNSVVTRPSVTLSGGNLTLTSIVRTNQPGLSVVGQWVTNVGLFTNTNQITTINGSTNGVSQTNVPAGCERQVFSVPQNTDTRKFLRLKVEM